MKKIIIMIIGMNLFVHADLSRAGNGIVIDSKTSLQWQDDYTPNNPNIEHVKWSDAISYCNNLTLGSYSDWRLPNANELLSIVDHTKLRPSISNVFAYIPNERYYYWSSTTFSHSTTSAYYVDFYGGALGYGYYSKDDKRSSRYVRCVRAGQ